MPSNENKTKIENKNTTNKHRYFFESNFVGINRFFVLVYLNADDAKWYSALKYYLLKYIIKNYKVIINEKSFYEQPIDCGIKRYKKISKLTTGQGEDYTTDVC